MQDHLKVGFIVSITARTTNNLLRVANNGMVECSGTLKQKPDLNCQFEVIGPGGAQPRAIRLRSMAYPQFYLAVVNGFFIGYVSPVFYGLYRTLTNQIAPYYDCDESLVKCFIL